MDESSSIVMNYNQGYYEQKIAVLESCARQLEQHLNTLDNLKTKINDFWQDDDALAYQKNLAMQINSVRNAQSLVDSLRATYTALQQEIKETKDKVTIDVTDISGMLSIIDEDSEG